MNPIDWLIHRRLEAFEAQWHYPMDYARALLAASRRGFWRFSKLMALSSHREGVPKAAWHAAKLVAIRAEDCGPCTQLIIDMARADGVSDALLRTVLAGDYWALHAIDADAADAVRFATAWLARAPVLDEARDEVRRRFGDAGLASLALAMSAARMYPMVKTALGHGQACQRVRVGADELVLAPE
ncbi:hypothetical protein [Aquabacterium humicola]|uniref:hypothetical protein n=1 Tax=Aquabacterium humicola TaxID=3237377 RepID=UPI002542DC24|nr:hypothetical protein [Rubrivivax pictus]